jgi:hypothetical protein
MIKRLLLCEGPDDVAFFQALIEVRDLPKFHIFHTGIKKGEAGGYTKYKTAIEALDVKYGKIHRQFDQILLVGDNDDDPDKRFANIQEHVEGALQIRPQKVRQFVIRKSPDLQIKIMMLPWDNRPGNLETLCYDPAKEADSWMRDKVNDFRSAVKADEWHDSRSKEMWLRSYLAAKCKDNPFVPLFDVFDKYSKLNLIPLKSKHFDNVCKELLTFA